MQESILEKTEEVHNHSRYYRKGCRCEECRRMRSEYLKQQKIKHFGSVPNQHGRNGYKTYGCRCAVCVAENRTYEQKRNRRWDGEKEILRRKKYREKYPEKARCKSWRAMGIKKDQKPVTFEQYSEIFNSQRGRCAVCDKELKLLSQQGASRSEIAHLDHDHRTGEARGILCSMCNKGIGFLNDDLQIAHGAVIYLSRFHNQ